MKWFKHENTFNNAKIEMLTDKHGIVGYGVYFRVLELVALAIDESNPEEWGYLPSIYTTDYLAKKLQTDKETLENILSTCHDLELLEYTDKKVYCPKILERCDDYTQRLLKQTPNKVGTKSEESPTKNRIDKIRIDKNINNNKTAVAVSGSTNELISYFKDINPNYERLYPNKSQRKSLDRMVDKHGYEKVKKSILYTVEVFGKKYAPQITTPMQLEEKMGSLIAFAKSRQDDKPIIAVMPEEL